MPDFHAFDSPEEFFEYMRSHQDRSAMSQESYVQEVVDFRHKLYEVFDGLDKDELEAMHQLFLNMVTGGKGLAILTAQYWVAWLVALRQEKFHICPACWEDHSAADREIAAEIERLKEETGGSE